MVRLGGDQPGPRDVRVEQHLFVRREQVAVCIVGQHGEERLLVRDLAAEGVRDADRTIRVGAEQCGAILPASEDVVHQHAAIDEIDDTSVGHQLAVLVHEVTRVGHHGGQSTALEPVLQDLELAPRRHAAEVDDEHRGGLAVPPHSR